MNLAKSEEYFSPTLVRERCHIIGCGSVGSTIAELLARLGLTKISLYDFDVVESHNIANQMFKERDIGKLKTEATAEIITEINPLAKDDIKLFSDGYNGERLSGYVFLCVDNIELRKKICDENKANRMIKAVFDFRTGLESSQHYAADWSSVKNAETLISTMNFSREEANIATPMSACHVELNVAPTVRLVCSYGIANFMNFAKKGVIKKMVLIDIFDFDIISV